MLIVGVVVAVIVGVIEGVLVTDGVLVIDSVGVIVGVALGLGGGIIIAVPMRSQTLKFTDPVILQSFWNMVPAKSQSKSLKTFI